MINKEIPNVMSHTHNSNYQLILTRIEGLINETKWGDSFTENIMDIIETTVYAAYYEGKQLGERKVNDEMMISLKEIERTNKDIMRRANNLYNSEYRGWE